MIRIAVTVTVLTLAAIARAWGGDIEDCALAEALLKSKSVRGVEACRRLAEQGDAVGQYALGELYRSETYIMALGFKHYSEIPEWYRKAAEQGFAPAMARLGYLYWFGLDVPQDYAESIKWSRMAAEQGITASQMLLGHNYLAGEGVPFDNVEAYFWIAVAIANAQSTDVEDSELLANAQKVLEGLEAKMTPDQIAKARRRAAEWKPTVTK